MGYKAHQEPCSEFLSEKQGARHKRGISPRSPRPPMAVRPSPDLSQGLRGYSHSYTFLKFHVLADIGHLLLGIGYINSGNKYLPADSPMLGKGDMPGARQTRCTAKDGDRRGRGTAWQAGGTPCTKIPSPEGIFPPVVSLSLDSCQHVTFYFCESMLCVCGGITH